MSAEIDILKRIYEQFNARDMDAVLGALDPNVVWANGMDGGYVYGRDGVRAYWTRQWAMLDPHVEPVVFSTGPDGEVVVEVHQVVHGLDGNKLADQMVGHIFHFKDGLIGRFDIRQPQTVPS
jgi:hypothetical protein